METQDLTIIPGERTEEDTRKTQVSPARRSVLVVEDDPASREYLVELLTEWGYSPIPVGSAEEAEYAVRHKQVEAAIIDVFLPGRSGSALMSKLRTRFPSSVLIGISALGDAGTARRCKGLGADLFLSKPVLPETLAKALQGGHHSWH